MTNNDDNSRREPSVLVSRLLLYIYNNTMDPFGNMPKSYVNHATDTFYILLLIENIFMALYNLLILSYINLTFYNC